MLNRFSEIRGRHRALVATPSVTCTLTAVFVVKLVKDMIDGRVKFHLWV